MGAMSEETAGQVAYSFSFAPKPRRKVTYRTYRACRLKAPCGNACVLNGNVIHSYHACKECACGVCHGERFRFGGQR